MDEVFQALADLKGSGASGALCTIIRTTGSTPRKEGSKMLVYGDGSIVGSVGGGEVEARVIQRALEAIQSDQSSIESYDLVDPDQGDAGVCGGSLEVFIDPLGHTNELVVVGGGHVGQAVVHLAKWLGYRVILTDDRLEFCQPDQVPGADEYIHCKISDFPSNYPLSTGASVVLATRNHKVDISGLPELLELDLGYIGVISSKRRWKLTSDELQKAGIGKKDIERVHAPIGLDIGAESPQEIALSIMAEVLSVRKERES